MKKINSLLIILLAFYIIGCNDQPSDIGVNLLPDTVQLKSISTYDTLLIPLSKVYKDYDSIMNTGAFFIGKAKNITALTLTTYAGIPDTLGWLTEDRIQSVQMTLQFRRYALGDTVNNNLSFDIVKVDKFASPKVNYDSIYVSPADYLGDKIAEYSKIVNLKDTIDPVIIDLPKSLATEWLKTKKVYDSTAKDSVDKKISSWGLALIPKEENKAIYSFHIATLTNKIESLIEVKYLNRNDSLVTIKFVIVGGRTLFDYPKDFGDDLVVWNGILEKSELTFDLSMLPKFSGIHKVYLELFLKPTKSFNGNNSLDSIVECIHYVNDHNIGTTSGSKTSDNKYTFVNVKEGIQSSNNRDGISKLAIIPNGVVNMYYELDKLVFHGIKDPDISKRPVLKVIYSPKLDMGK